MVVLAMLKGYTDMIAGRLDIVRSGEGAFRAVEQSVKQAVAKAYAGWAPVYDLVFGSVFETGRKA